MRPQKNDRPQKQQKHRINRQIRIPTVQVIDLQGQKLGVMSTQDALRKAEELGLDLVEIAATQQPPLCKLMDYGKFQYSESKKQKEIRHRERQNQTKLKTVSVRPTTDVHDLAVKTQAIRGFLEDGHKVSFEVFMTGRERMHPEQATKMIQQILAAIQDIATLEQAPVQNDRRMTALFGRKAAKPKAAPGPHGPKT